MKTENGLHEHNAILLRLKKDEIMPIPVTRKKLEIIILSEVSERERQV